MAVGVLRRLTVVPVVGPWLHHPLAVLHTRAGHFDSAVAECRSALALDRAWGPTILHHLGQAQLAHGELEGAEQSFRRAVEVAPESALPYLRLGEVLLRQNRAADAETVLHQGLTQVSAHKWRLHAMLIRCMLRQGRGDRVIDYLISTASGNEPVTDIPFPAHLATARSATPERADALRRILARDPHAIEPRVFLARILSYLGRYAEATAVLERARLGGRNGRCRQPPVASEPKLPTVLLIGQAKAGTSALFHWLCRHPGFAAPVVKEIHYWSQFSDAGLGWYRAHFPVIPKDDRTISGEASASYFIHPLAPERIAAAFPATKLILVLRDPVIRAYSEFQMFTRLGLERRGWEDVIDAELIQVAVCPLTQAELPDQSSLPGRRTGYLLSSAALPYLERWLALFPSEQILILPSTELFGNAPAAVARVLRFLGLPPVPLRCGEPVNEGYYAPMSPQIELRLRAWFAPHERALAAFLAARREHPAPGG